MHIDIRKVSPHYQHVTITIDDTVVDMGLLNQKESLELISVLSQAIDYLVQHMKPS